MKLLHAYAPAGDNIAAEPDELGVIAAAGVIHDLGNLIQIASSAINIIARTPNMPAIHAGPMLDRAKICLEHAGALVHQNIGLIRNRMIADERSSVAKCLLDVAALVEALDEPDLVLDIDIEPTLPRVQCDAIGIRRAVLNLVFNARDALEGRGIVRIEARAIWRGLTVAGVAIRVADDGVGMSPATIARAFDPFFTTKTDGLGGIGLPMVARFVRDAGGEVAIESEPGVGTTVTLRLPAITPTEGTDAPTHSRGA
jgi:signal transduction histidine kinase